MGRFDLFREAYVPFQGSGSFLLHSPRNFVVLVPPYPQWSPQRFGRSSPCSFSTVRQGSDSQSVLEEFDDLAFPMD